MKCDKCGEFTLSTIPHENDLGEIELCRECYFEETKL